MSITVFGIYCREDKEVLFLRVNGKKKRDLWPCVARHCDPKTSIICTDSAAQYTGVEKLFDNAVHKTTNHQKGEFVDKKDKTNTINALENQNKIFKKALKSRRNEAGIRSHMATHFYRRMRLKPLKTLGEQVIYHFSLRFFLS